MKRKWIMTSSCFGCHLPSKTLRYTLISKNTTSPGRPSTYSLKGSEVWDQSVQNAMSPNGPKIRQPWKNFCWGRYNSCTSGDQEDFRFRDSQHKIISEKNGVCLQTIVQNVPPCLSTPCHPSKSLEQHPLVHHLYFRRLFSGSSPLASCNPSIPYAPLRIQTRVPGFCCWTYPFPLYTSGNLPGISALLYHCPH